MTTETELPQPIKKPRDWSRLLLESFMVFIGVLLAFIIEEWREEYQLEQEVELAKERIFEELQTNYRFLENFKRHVDERYELINAMEGTIDNSVPFVKLRHKFIGYRFVQFQSSAWLRANANQLANHMDEDMLTEALKIYNWNESLIVHNRRIDEIRFTSHFYDPADAHIAYEMSRDFIRQQVGWADDMAKMYRRFFDHFIYERTARDEAPDIND